MTVWDDIDAIKRNGDTLTSELKSMGWETVDLPGLYAARKRHTGFRVVARSSAELLRKIREHAERKAAGRAAP